LPRPKQAPAKASHPLFADTCTAEDVREKLRKKYPATQHMGGARIPGPWVTVEEWNQIDLLAIGVTGATKREWIAHEIKVSRGDLRIELLRPWKRDSYKTHVHRLYLAVPDGLLTPEELEFEEPEFEYKLNCPEGCSYHGGSTRTKIRVPVPAVRESLHRGRAVSHAKDWTRIRCPGCDGLGSAEFAAIVREAPTLWIPRDVGLILVDGRSAEVFREAPLLEPEELDRKTLGQLVRWVSARPDPRHDDVVATARAVQKADRDNNRQSRIRKAA